MEKIKFNLNWEIFLIAGNLRLAIIVIPPLSTYIMQAFKLSATEMGILTTIPLVCFGIFSVLAPLVIHRLGTQGSLLLSLTLLLVANFVRIYSLPLLFLGTALVGTAITLLNVLIPTIIMERAPEKASILNGLYIAALSLWAALIGYSAAFLAKNIGWQAVIQLVSLPPVVAFCGWFLLPKKISNAQVNDHHAPMPQKKSLKQLLVKQPRVLILAFFMGMQSFIFYGLVAWLPSILSNLKLSVLAVGGLFALFQFSGIPISYLIPRLKTSRRTLQTVLIFLLSGYLIGLGLLLLGKPSLLLLTSAVICLGLTTAAIFSLSLSLITTLAHSAREASAIGGIVQSIGYLIACLSPTLLGQLKTSVGNWEVALVVLLLLACCTFLVGLLFVSSADPKAQ
ncbi:MFS transporter [Liquorilactobacillus satsumensis]|uniref:MFS transporter n=1 Tax=Liquorilactobacillus satsumensis TaxID=259059 RepID=UPI0021C4A52C|nr:MFS transporter [Liquorilactobacillus satsumensis]MCP9312779.1 MFS transporter [Liquorilactobacillus satsumensis]MCP9359207.1 MFS transporter [Liquorilactobacillus satsumensis]